MFGKKEKNTTEPVAPITARIETMPGAFYGGADPIIYAGNVASKENTEVQIVPPPLAPKKVAPSLPPKPPLGPSSNETQKPDKPMLQKPPVRAPQKSKALIFVVLGIVLLGGIAFAVYYFLFRPIAPPIVESPSPVSNEPFVASPVITAPTTTPAPIIDTPTSTPSSTPISRGGGVLSIPHVSYAPARDDDSDSLSNSEEETVFQTDPEVWDTDSDGYFDGREVANLYNPKGIAPQKIIDSGIVREYINPTYQYRFYYPASWRVDSVTDDFRDILVSGNSGDYIEIRVFQKESTVSFQDWFTATLPQEPMNDFASMKNRFQVPFYKHQNSQSAFFETPTAVYSIVYFYGEQEKNAFAHVMDVLVQSFRPTKGGFELPVQPVLPGVTTTAISTPAVTSTIDIPVASSTATSTL